MVPRFVGRLGAADYVTVANAALGFAATAAALVDPGTAARLVLLAAVADGLDGVIARHTGGTPVGPYLDALADVASFCVAPALFVFAVALEGRIGGDTAGAVVAVLLPALFVATGVVRLGLYTAHDPEGPVTVGVPTTLAATLLATAYLAGVVDPRVLLAATGAFAYLMVTRVRYPDLYARDALAMGGVQVLAVAAPAALSRLFPRALLAAALAYLLLAPRFYWRPVDGAGDGTAGGSGEGDDPGGAGPPGAAPSDASGGPDGERPASDTGAGAPADRERDSDRAPRGTAERKRS